MKLQIGKRYVDKCGGTTDPLVATGNSHGASFSDTFPYRDPKRGRCYTAEGSYQSSFATKEDLVAEVDATGHGIVAVPAPESGPGPGATPAWLAAYNAVLTVGSRIETIEAALDYIARYEIDDDMNGALLNEVLKRARQAAAVIGNGGTP